MRARLLLLVLTGLLAAGLAVAKPSKKPPPAPGASNTGSAASSAAPAPTTLTARLPPKPLAMPATFTPLPPSTQADIDQCRTACAHTYYFCSAGSDTDDCAPTWTSCRAACVNPPPQTDTQPLPGVR